MGNNTNTLLVIVAFLSFIALGFNVGILGVAWPSIRDEFGLSQDAIGALFLTLTIGSFTVSLNSGRIIAKVGLGWLLTVGGVIGGLGFLGYALAPGWIIMVLFGAVATTGTAGVVAGLNTFFAISQSQRLMNWLQACFGLGATISPLAVTRMLDAGTSWRWAYGLVALFYGGMAASFGLTLKNWRIAGEAGPTPTVTNTETLRLRALWLSLVLFFASSGLEGSTGQWPYTLFTEARGVDAGTAGLWVSVFWASLTGGRLLFGAVVSRVGAVRLVRAAMATGMCGTLLIWWHLSDLLSFLGLALIGFAWSSVFPVLTSNTPERVGAPHAPNAIGFQMAAATLGIAVLPGLAGVLAEAFGLEIIGPYLFVLSVAAFVLHEGRLRGVALSHNVS